MWELCTVFILLCVVVFLMLNKKKLKSVDGNIQSSNTVCLPDPDSEGRELSYISKLDVSQCFQGMDINDKDSFLSYTGKGRGKCMSQHIDHKDFTEGPHFLAYVTHEQKCCLRKHNGYGAMYVMKNGKLYLDENPPDKKGKSSDCN
jgi:hypothetical protein